MARPMKKVVQPIKEVVQTSHEVIQEIVEESTNTTEVIQDNISNLLSRVFELEIRILELEKICSKPEGKLINKVEKFNDEVPSTIESYNGMKMDASDRIQSMQNAIKILPPNMVVKTTGRHMQENVEAIVGFKVSDEMMDKAYAGWKRIIED
jgi:predicted translin family RNA/ssDNA-binding protein